MAFFHLRSTPGNEWPRIPAAEAAQVWAAYLELDRTQWMNAEELERMQLTQLRVLLAHCYEHVPYYRRIMTDAGLSRPVESLDELRRLPILTREVYRDHFAELQATSLPAGMRAAWTGHTSGTTGVPLQVRKTNHDGTWWNALFLRDLEWSGLDPRLKLAAIRMVAYDPEQLPRALEGGSVPYWTKLCGALLESGPSHVMDIRQDPRRQLEWLRAVEPDYLISHPSNLDCLSRLLREDGGRLERLRVIQAFAEALEDPARRRIESGFGVPIRNLYSTSEGGYMASPCPLGHGLHLHAENVLAEVLDAADRPCGPGETGRLVFTTLHSFLAPFVRYDILDYVTLGPGPCPCGRGLPLWTHVQGRRHPLFHLADGRRKSSFGLTYGIGHIEGIRQFQIIQRAHAHVVVRVVPDRDWTPDSEARVRHEVNREMELEVRVDVERLQSIERPAGGKLRIVVNELEERSAPS